MVELEAAERLVLDDVVAVVTERDVLSVRGDDAASYLHGQLSQDVEGLLVGATAWTLLLQPQGKVEAWMRIHRLAADEFLLDVEVGFAAQARERLERFMLRVDVQIELHTAAVVALRGPGAAEAASRVAEGAVIALDATWGGTAGVDLLDGELRPSVDLAALGLEGLPVGPPELLDVVRVRQGRPAMGAELDSSTIPAAAGIVDSSVDFTKGCYVGQELVARIDSRGNNTPTRLYGLRIAGPDLPAWGSDLLLDGEPGGRMTSAAVSPSLGVIGLGYLKRSVDVPATLQLKLADGSDRQVQAVELPMGAP